MGDELLRAIVGDSASNARSGYSQHIYDNNFLYPENLYGNMPLLYATGGMHGAVSGVDHEAFNQKLREIRSGKVVSPRDGANAAAFGGRLGALSGKIDADIEEMKRQIREAGAENLRKVSPGSINDIY